MPGTREPLQPHQDDDDDDAKIIKLMKASVTFCGAPWGRHTPQPHYRDQLTEPPMKGPPGVEGDHPIVAHAHLRPVGGRARTGNQPGSAPRLTLRVSHTGPAWLTRAPARKPLRGSCLSKTTLVRKPKSRPGFRRASVARFHVRGVTITGASPRTPGQAVGLPAPGAWGQGRLLGSTPPRE